MSDQPEMLLGTHCVKIHKPGKRNGWFFTGDGMNSLRVYAVTFSQTQAEEVAKRLAADNPQFTFSARPL